MFTISSDLGMVTVSTEPVVFVLGLIKFPTILGLSATSQSEFHNLSLGVIAVMTESWFSTVLILLDTVSMAFDTVSLDFDPIPIELANKYTTCNLTYVDESVCV